MRKVLMSAVLPTVMLGILASNPAQAAPTSLEEKVASVLPTEQEEKWLQIPWRSDLMEARAQAERENKPLYLWIMDGNPLACG